MVKWVKSRKQQPDDACYEPGQLPHCVVECWELSAPPPPPPTHTHTHTHIHASALLLNSTFTVTKRHRPWMLVIKIVFDGDAAVDGYDLRLKSRARGP